jgi:hypothetical protein
MNKATKITYNGGMNKDISKSKFQPQFYFEGKNIRIIATDSQSTGSVTNEKGNSLILELPSIVINDGVITYGNKTLLYTTNELTNSTSTEQVIIGHSYNRECFILFTTDNNGIDCIWKLNESDFDLRLLYVRNLNFSSNYPIWALSNFENKKIDKVYWVDGVNQMRFLNINHSISNGDLEQLIDIPVTTINQVSNFNLSQPQITDKLVGGNHTSGMIQYAYNLYRINSSQTKISPLSELISLDKSTLGGGEVNEVVSTTPIIYIPSIDKNYTNLKLYSIKYTSYNQIPEISLLLDTDITNNEDLTYYDDGNIIQNVSLEQFTFLGSDIIIPKHINSKDNRLFSANYEEKNYNIDLDCRAYSFQALGNSKVVDRFETVGSNPLFPIEEITIDFTTPNYDSIPLNHSSINKDYDKYKYTNNGIQLGGEGKYLKYELKRRQDLTLKADNVFKDNEIYRIGLQFYNLKGQISLPKWIADFKTHPNNLDQSNLNGWFSYLEITLKSEFYTWLNDSNNFLTDEGNYDEELKPVGYKILRADRTLNDKTIICQGIINTMMSMGRHGGDGFNVSDFGENYGLINTNNEISADNGLKMPSLMRRIDSYLSPIHGMDNYSKLDRQIPFHPQSSALDSSPSNEVYKSTSSSGWIKDFWQYNHMMQLFSPEILFDNINNININSKLKIIGGIENNNNEWWSQLRNPETKETAYEAKGSNSLTPWDIKCSETLGTLVKSIADPYQNFKYGLIATNEGYTPFSQYLREYKGNFKRSLANTSNPYNTLIFGGREYDFYGTPIITEKGQGRTVYNNDINYAYSNSWQPILTDDSVSAPAVIGANSYGAKNLTFVLGLGTSILPKNRINYKNLHTHTLLTDQDISLIGEIKIPEIQIYIGNIYGGNTYESKKRTNYIEIGEYININNSNIIIYNPGDTFINDFKFTKLVKTDVEKYGINTMQTTEIVSVRIETSVNLKNRNDSSIGAWDSIFQTRYDDFHKYNKVYSQQPNLFLRKDLNYNFKKENIYDANVIASSLKSPGELIDSWTNLLPNEVLSLDGKYGPITHLHNFKDELYTFQDNGVAFLSINPRVQVQGSDGISVELGSGQVLQEYKYISTDSGTLNKWSVVNSPQTFYFYDLNNKSIKMFNNGASKLSDIKGLHSFLQNNTTDGLLKNNNPILRAGITSGYDYINNEAFMTFLQGNKSFTINYNELTQSFISLYDYLPNMYISKGNNFLVTHPNNKKIYKQYAGQYNVYFDTYYPSYITLMLNPEADLDCVFDNIQFKSELYLNDIDQPDETLTKIQAYNEYQNSGLIPLELGRNKNLRRKFRDWHALIPREGRNRIRNPWVYLKLQLDNEDNYKMILHDIICYYTV